MEQKDKLNFFHTKNKVLIVFVLFLTAFICTLPLFVQRGLPQSHDIIFHLFYADQFKQSIDSGLIYPRWILNSNNGYGSPHFIFYSPLSYYFVSIINFIVPSLIFSMAIAIGFSFFLSGLTMFITTKRMFGWSGSIISAIIYQILPFHLLDLYARGTFAELFAFMWFPLIILFIHEIFKKDTIIALFGLTVAYAGLILTHLMSGFIFSFVMGGYLIYNYFLSRDKKALLNALISIVLGLCLASFYLVPIIFERKFVHIEYILNCPACDYKNNFLFIRNKLMLKYFYLGLHIGVFLEILLFLSIVLLIFKNRNITRKSQQNFFIFLFLITFILTTPLSRPIWDFFFFFPTLQFPWRWLAVTELSLCFLISGVFSNDDRPRINSIDFKKRAVVYILITLLMFSGIIIFKGKTWSGELLRDILNPQQIRFYMDPTIEYTPIRVDKIQEIMAEENYEKVSIISGTAQIQSMQWKPENRIVSIKSLTSTVIRVRTFYYPGWKALLDGKKTPIMIEKNTGAMRIDIPEGEHILELRFEDTVLRLLSKVVSLASCFILLSLLMIKRNI